LTPQRSAAHQSSQQEGVGFGAAGAEGAVVGGGPPGGLEGVVVDDGRYRDRHPLVSGPSGLAVPAELVVVAGVGAVPEQTANVGLVAQDTPDGGQDPLGLAFGGDDPVVAEFDGDAPDGYTGEELGEDALHHGRFGFVHDHVGVAVGPPGHTPISVGDLAGQDLAGPGPEQLASTFAFSEFGPLVFCDDALDLDQQAGLGVVEGRGVAEQDWHLVAGELVEDQHLVGVGPGQAVG
jgi:hypothetical protein